MNNNLDMIKETSKYYKVLLKIFSTNASENYNLTEEEMDLFRDDELFNRFTADLAGTIILTQIEYKSDQEPNEHAFNKLFKIESTTVDSLKEKMKQIRNCFAHSNTKNSEGNIEFDNGKIKGEISIDQLIFLPAIYGLNDIQEIISGINEINVHQIDQKSLINNLELYMNMLLLGKTRILAGGIINEQISNKDDLEKLFKMGKVVRFLDKKMKNNEKNYMYSDAILKLIDWKNMSSTQLTKLLNSKIPGNANFQIKSLREYSELIKSYIDYIGEDSFYKLNFLLQRDLITRVVNIKENEERNKISELTSLALPILEIKKLAEKGISEVNINPKDPKHISDLIINSYSIPFMYENVMHAYIYNRLIYLKEMLNTNQINESILNYSNIDISSISYQYTFTKNDIKERIAEINRSLLNINNSIEKLQFKKAGFENKLYKNNNPQNPKRDKIVSEYTNKINNVETLIIQEQNQKKKLEEEKKYIVSTKNIPLTPNMIFRTLRNSAAHSYRISLYSRIKSLKNHNLEDLMFEFEDKRNKGSKAQINMTAARLIKLITDIENSIIKNINKINAIYNPLEDAIDETQKNTRIGEITRITNKIASGKKDKISQHKEDNLETPKSL